MDLVYISSVFRRVCRLLRCRQMDTLTQKVSNFQRRQSYKQQWPRPIKSQFFVVLKNNKKKSILILDRLASFLPPVLSVHFMEYRMLFSPCLNAFSVEKAYNHGTTLIILGKILSSCCPRSLISKIGIKIVLL